VEGPRGPGERSARGSKARSTEVRTVYASFVVVAGPERAANETAAEVERVYHARLADRSAVLAASERQHLWLSRMRVVLVGLTILIPIAGGLGYAGWSLVPLLLFGLLAAYHGGRLNEMRKARLAVAFYEKGLERRSHSWIGKGESGAEFRQPDHP